MNIIYPQLFLISIESNSRVFVAIFLVPWITTFEFWTCWPATKFKILTMFGCSDSLFRFWILSNSYCFKLKLSSKNYYLSINRRVNCLTLFSWLAILRCRILHVKTTIFDHYKVMAITNALFDKQLKWNKSKSLCCISYDLYIVHRYGVAWYNTNGISQHY